MEGIHEREMTLAELCKQKGYDGNIRKMASYPKFLPLNHGFDEYHGIPYSTHMWPWHPRYHGFIPDDPKRREVYPDLPLIENDRVIDADVTAEDQKMTQCNGPGSDFIDRKHKKPFFLYSLFYGARRYSLVTRLLARAGGLLGDVIMELDDSIKVVDVS